MPLGDTNCARCSLAIHCNTKHLFGLRSFIALSENKRKRFLDIAYIYYHALPSSRCRRNAMKYFSGRHICCPYFSVCSACETSLRRYRRTERAEFSDGCGISAFGLPLRFSTMGLRRDNNDQYNKHTWNARDAQNVNHRRERVLSAHCRFQAGAGFIARTFGGGDLLFLDKSSEAQLPSSGDDEASAEHHVIKANAPRL